jgi:hypothetical protein
MKWLLSPFKGLLFVVLWLWQFPQNILGFFFWCVYRKKIIRRYKVSGLFTKIYIVKDNGFLRDNWSEGVSLANYIFLDSGYDLPEYHKHEAGHCSQSLITGLLYLLIVGIVSSVRASMNLPKEEYFGHWPEKQASRWGQKFKIEELK